MSSDPQRPSRRPAATEPDWMTLGQAAKFLGVAQSTIRKWSDLGRVPAFYTPGGHRRYRRSDLESFIQRSGPGGQETGPVVLVVDDDARVRHLVRVNLEAAGYAVREAERAEEALAVIDREELHLVLLDVVMPGTDGWQLLQRMQERHGSIPVIMFSGQVEDENGLEAARRGADDFVGKPFDPQQLVERAKRLVPV
jgi:excisionase family DNA binding protein